jgi:hypothetical protein
MKQNLGGKWEGLIPQKTDVLKKDVMHGIRNLVNCSQTSSLSCQVSGPEACSGLASLPSLSSSYCLLISLPFPHGYLEPISAT